MVFANYRIWILFIFLICMTPQVRAQAFINIESIRQIEGEGYVGRTGLQVSGQDGNTQKFTSQFSTIGAYRYDNNEWLYTGAYKYGSSANIKDTNLGSAHLRHTWHIQDPVAYELFTQTGFDEMKQLNSRNYLGGNLRFRLLYTDIHRLYSGVGTFYEIEDFSGSEDEEGFRGNVYISYVNKLSETVSGFVILYYQPKLKGTQNYRVRAQTGLDIRLSKNLSLDIDFNLVHDTGLPEDVKPTDTDYMTGFSYSY